MFRKKKNVGSVTVFDDEPDDAADQFDDLGLADHKPASDAHDLDHMSARELEALALSTATAGKQSTTRALRMANEARDAGVTTAAQMKAQTAQLEKMSDDIEVVHDYLDRSERLIDKMSKPRIVRLFQRTKQAGKGLDKVKAGRKETEARAEIREKGLESVDIDNMAAGSSGHLSMNDLERENDRDRDRDELFEAEAVTDVKRRGLGRRKKKQDVEQKDPRQIREDYSHYSAPVAQVMQKQDDDLDQIADALSDMRTLAGAMNNELEYQDKLINEVQDFTAETSRRTKENAKKISRIK